MASRGLGRGLDALLSGGSSGGLSLHKQDGETAVLKLLVDNIIPNPNQPRKIINQDSLEELAQSIRTQGIIQPLLVRKSKIPGKYEIVAGERRWRAATLAGLTEVPVYIRNLTDIEVMLAALLENIQREDLTPTEKARALKEIKDTLHLSLENMSVSLGMSCSAIANALRILKLPEDVQDLIQEGKLSAGHAKCLLAVISSEEALRSLLAHILENALSVRDSEDAVNFWKTEGHMPWAGKEEAAPPLPTPTKARHRKPVGIKAMERTLGSRLGCKTRFSGSTENGRVSISYTSKADFLRIMGILGADETMLESVDQAEQPEE